METESGRAVQHAHVPGAAPGRAEENLVVACKQFDKSGAFSLEVCKKPVPRPGHGQVLVRMRARPVNPSDIMFLKGIYAEASEAPINTPAVPGFEGVGVIQELGQGVRDLQQGDRVIPLHMERAPHMGNGTWQRFIVQDASEVLKVPEAVQDYVAACTYVNPCTVLGLFRTLNPPPGETIIQTGAGSACGRMMIQYCASKGVNIINLVRRQESIDELQQLAGDKCKCQGIATSGKSSEQLCSEICNALGGKKAYGALDCVGTEITKCLQMAVRRDGDVLLYGALGGDYYVGSITDLLMRHVHIKRFSLTHYLEKQGRESEQLLLQEALGLLANKTLTPAREYGCFNLTDVQKALEAGAKPARGGKVLLCDYETS